MKRHCRFDMYLGDFDLASFFLVLFCLIMVPITAMAIPVDYSITGNADYYDNSNNFYSYIISGNVRIDDTPVVSANATIDDKGHLVCLYGSCGEVYLYFSVISNHMEISPPGSSSPLLVDDSLGVDPFSSYGSRIQWISYGYNDPSDLFFSDWFVLGSFWGVSFGPNFPAGNLTLPLEITNLSGRDGPTIDGMIFDHALLTLTADSVPEPTTMLLFGTGLAGLGLLRKRFKL